MDRCIRVVHSAIWSLSLTDFVRWEWNGKERKGVDRIEIHGMKIKRIFFLLSSFSPIWFSNSKFKLKIQFQLEIEIKFSFVYSSIYLSILPIYLPSTKQKKKCKYFLFSYTHIHIHKHHHHHHYPNAQDTTNKLSRWTNIRIREIQSNEIPNDESVSYHIIYTQSNHPSQANFLAIAKAISASSCPVPKNSNLMLMPMPMSFILLLQATMPALSLQY